MRERDQYRRVKTHLADNVSLVIVVVLVLGAFGGYLTYTTHVDPGTQVETVETASWESTGDFSHYASVVNGTAAFEEGERLRNRTVYFTRTTPRLNGSFSYAYTASAGGELDANTTLSVVLRSVEPGDGDEPATTYWQIDRQLGQQRMESLSPGEGVRTPFSVNVSAVAEDVKRVDDQLGGTPGQLRIDIVATVSLAGTRNDHTVETTRSYQLPIDPSGSVYRVNDPGTVRTEDTETTQVTVQATDGPLRRAVGPALLVLSFAGVLALGYGAYTGRLSVSDRERAWLSFQADRREFDEWISTGAVSTADRRPTTVETDSLAGLVNVAIDTDSRVIEDTRTGAFYVFAGDERFRFDPPAEPDRGGDDQGAPLDRLAADDQPEPADPVASENGKEPDGEVTGDKGDESDNGERADEDFVATEE